jgi:Zn-dependent peptidase ImmA (M78 family)/transcriptional regulator with XRE-family HTH domain
MSDRVYNPAMLLLAREARGATQEELAQESGVSQALISKVEHGLSDLSEESASALAKALGFPVEFFKQTDRLIGLPHFHAKQRSRVPVKTLSRIGAMINIRRQHIVRLLRSYEMEATKPIPQIDLEEQGLTPEKVAARMREYWLVRRGPVPSVTEIIEEAGGIVMLARFGTNLLDGLSIRSEGLPPMFFMNRDVTGDRFRFSLARELGHIIMHRIPEDDDMMERQAYRFAAAFLMPADDIRPHLSHPKLTTLTRAKAYWKVPISDMIERAYYLKLITDYQHRKLKTEYSKAFEDAEPLPTDIESPRRLRDMVKFHMEKLGYTVSDLAKLLCAREDYIAQTYLDRPRLRLVT